MTRNRAGILYGICFVLFSAIMTAWHWVLTGINEQFGAGAALGLILGIGIMALLSRRVRELD